MNKLPKDGPVISDVLIVCVNDTPFFINLSRLGVTELFLESKILSARNESIVINNTLGSY